MKKDKLTYNHILTKDPMFSKCNKEARCIELRNQSIHACRRIQGAIGQGIV